jgi:queuine tRNA-ribosyltransferase
MGVGYPVDLVVCACLGVDMFDCVYPTRTARFGTALTRFGLVDVKKCGLDDHGPLDPTCACATCTRYTRSYLASIFQKEPAACHFLTIHNLTFLLTLMRNLRASIIEGTLDTFVVSFLKDWFGNEPTPDWVRDALTAAGVDTSTL